jgi:hypothetical protein
MNPRAGGLFGPFSWRAEGRRRGSIPQHTLHAQHDAQVTAHSTRHTIRCRSTSARVGLGYSATVHKQLGATDRNDKPSCERSSLRGPTGIRLVHHGQSCAEDSQRFHLRTKIKRA